MTREEKLEIIESLTEKFKENPYFYITDASGFTVAQVNTFRRTCFERGVEYKVYKNTLIAKASLLDKRKVNVISNILPCSDSGILTN